MADNQLGPVVRLRGIQAAQLPPSTASPDELAPLLLSIVQEAVPFIDSAAPRDPEASAAHLDVSSSSPWKWKRKGTKKLEGSTAPVELTVRTISSAEILRVVDNDSAAVAETWVCRRSVHEDKAAVGTASWHEFRDCIKDRHAETEEAFTPSMVSHRTVASWQCGDAKVDLGGQSSSSSSRDGRHHHPTKWGEFTLRLEQIRHKIGRPVLKDRTFAVLQLTCAAQPPPPSGPLGEEFLIVNIPVSGKLGGDDGGSTGATAEKDTVAGAYASVERVRKTQDDGIEWLMATASDAGGVLPMWMQTMAVPGQISKDVPMFLSWLAKQR